MPQALAPIVRPVMEKLCLAGRKGGYGNTVVIQHGRNTPRSMPIFPNTAKGIRSGLRVRSRANNSYVGSSGLATGPTLAL